MSFKICYDGLLAAGEQNDLDFYDTENILVSLISQVNRVINWEGRETLLYRMKK